MKLAFTTFAILKQPYGHPEVQEFDDRTPDVFKEAENSPGFIERACAIDNCMERSNFERDWGKWGKFEVPRFYAFGKETSTDQRASTLSIWKDIPYVFQFAYSNLHREALRKRKEWFLEPKWPTYAAWWITDDHIPQWKEACRKLEELYDKGPSPSVFNFKRCFDAQKRPINVGLNQINLVGEHK